MWKQFLTGMMAALILLQGTPCLGAGKDRSPQETCLDQLSYKLQPGTWIRVTASDGSRCEGQLGQIDLAQSLLSVQPTKPDTAFQVVYQTGDIDKLQYRERRPAKPGHVVVGVLAFGFLGGMIGVATAKEDPNAWMDYSRLDAAVTGALIGSIVGLGAGIFSSQSREVTRTIKCE